MTPDEKKQALALVARIQEQSNKAKPESIRGLRMLLPYQARWHEDKSPVRIAEKSRRIGFSWGCLAAESVMEAALTADAGGQDQFYMGYNQAMAAEFIGDCAFFARALGKAASAIDVEKETVIINDDRRDIITYRITLASGFKIEALSSAPHNWRSRQGHARIDEAAFHDNLAEVIKGALAFYMWGGRVDIISTHDSDENHFNQLIQDVKAGKLNWSLHRVTFDDALREGFYRRVCLVRGLEWSQENEEKYRSEVYATYPSTDDADEELSCIPKRGSGTYFSRMLIQRCQEPGIPVLLFSQEARFVLDDDRYRIAQEWINDHLKPVIDAMPLDRLTALGQDFGRDGDLSDIWAYQKDGPDRWRTAFLLEMRRIPFDVQLLVLFYILDNIPLFHHMKFDARGNGQSHAEAALQRYGTARIECVMLTAQWYGVNMVNYHQAYEDQSIIAPESEDIIADHRAVKLKDGRPYIPSNVRTKGRDGGLRHADSAVAGALGWAATNAKVVHMDFASSGDRRVGSEIGGINQTGFGTVGGQLNMRGF
jgi:phage FluMu gp28-like protein